MHYYKVRYRSLTKSMYLIIDTQEYLADMLFVQEQVRVYFGDEFQKPGEKYLAIYCKVKKSDEKAFLRALDRLPNKMLLCGNTDYLEFCNKFFHEWLNIPKEKESEENTNETLGG